MEQCLFFLRGKRLLYLWVCLLVVSDDVSFSRKRYSLWVLFVFLGFVRSTSGISELESTKETSRSKAKKTKNVDQIELNSNHTSNHAIIVSASRYWFNYRHNANALSMYKLLRSNGYSDDNIVLMLADDYITNSRNPLKNGIFIEPNGISQKKSSSKKEDEAWMDSILDPFTTQIDYRGEDVTVENFINVLTGGGGGRNKNALPVLASDSNSNVLVYVTGHGGDQFFKFLDVEEILSEQFGLAIRRMYDKGMYNELLFVADTCQAFTLGDHITSPNVVMIGSSLKGQSSYAHHSDSHLGLSIIEKYTYHFIKHVTTRDPKLKNTIQQDMIDPFPFDQQRANIGVSDATSTRKINQIPMKDFFTNIEHRKLQRRMRFESSNKKQATLTPVVTLLSEFEINNIPSSFSNPSSSTTDFTSLETCSQPDVPHRKNRSTNVHNCFKNNAACTEVLQQQKSGIQLDSPTSTTLPMEPSDNVFLLLVAILIGFTVVAKKFMQ